MDYLVRWFTELKDGDFPVRKLCKRLPGGKKKYSWKINPIFLW